MTKKSEKIVRLGDIDFKIVVERTISFIEGNVWEMKPDETLHIENIRIYFTVKGQKFVGTDVRELDPRFRSEKEKLEKGAFGIITGTPMSLKKESYDIMITSFEEAKEEAMFDEWKEYVEEKENKKIAKKLASAKKSIEEAEREIASNGKLMTASEIKTWNRNYNNVMNEGGSGYIPSHVSIEEYEEAKKILGENK